MATWDKYYAAGSVMRPCQPNPRPNWILSFQTHVGIKFNQVLIFCSIFRYVFWKLSLASSKWTKNCEVRRTAGSITSDYSITGFMLMAPTSGPWDHYASVAKLYQNSSSWCFPPLSRILWNKTQGYLQKTLQDLNNVARTTSKCKKKTDVRRTRRISC